MISLIMNEICVFMKSVHIRQCIARIMFQKMIILNLNETTSRGSFNQYQAKHVQNGGGCGEEARA